MGDEAERASECITMAEIDFIKKERFSSKPKGKGSAVNMAKKMEEVNKAPATKTKVPKTVNGVTENMIARYYTVDQSQKELGKEREALGETIKKLWPDNEMHILGSYSVEKKVMETRTMDKDILFKLVSERLGKDETEELFELAKSASPRVLLSVKKAAA